MLCCKHERKVIDFKLILDKKESQLLKECMQNMLSNLTISKEQQDLLTSLSTGINIYLKED